MNIMLDSGFVCQLVGKARRANDQCGWLMARWLREPPTVFVDTFIQFDKYKNSNNNLVSVAVTQTTKNRQFYRLSIYWYFYSVWQIKNEKQTQITSWLMARWLREPPTVFVDTFIIPHNCHQRHQRRWCKIFQVRGIFSILNATGTSV